MPSELVLSVNADGHYVLKAVRHIGGRTKKIIVLKRGKEYVLPLDQSDSTLLFELAQVKARLARTYRVASLCVFAIGVGAFILGVAVGLKLLGSIIKVQ